MTVFDNILVPENLYYAWKKVRRLFQTADGFVDQVELASFELDLEAQLATIHEDFKSGNYKLQPLRPVPRPKKMVKGKAINRQYFHVSVRDQVAWVAVVNALGPRVDEKMPAWSYGNRIYRAAWYDETPEGSKLERGPYRHQSGHLYKKFQHSWPLFRRHVSLTAREMVRSPRVPLSADLDQADQKALAAAVEEKLPYLRTGYWNESRNPKNKMLFHAGIDLEKFYPRLRLSAIKNGLRSAIAEPEFDDRLNSLLTSMLDFQFDLRGVPDFLLNENVEPSFSQEDISGLPTGLFVAGFLSNAAMLPVDLVVNKKLETRREISHFRFVDDHVIIAYNFDALCDWINEYKEILAEYNLGVNINTDKYDPESLFKYLNSANKTGNNKEDTEELRASALADTEIDGTNPTRLLTKTLAQVSEIANTNVDLLDNDDLKERLKTLEWLLLADIPEREVRPDTRAAFAAGQIATTVPSVVQEINELVDSDRRIKELTSRKNKTSSHALIEQKKEFNKKLKEHNDLEKKFLRKYFLMLLQAFNEFPNKARLFYRLLQYCRITGHMGIHDIGEWINDTRSNDNKSWADYYAALSQQILSNTILSAVRTLKNSESLRSDRQAALRHLNDITSMNLRIYIVPESRKSWYYKSAQNELGISMLSAAVELKQIKKNQVLANKLLKKARKILPLDMTDTAETWTATTGYSVGSWAHHIEKKLSLNDKPSQAWLNGFRHVLNNNASNEILALRRYPELISDEAWYVILTEIKRPPDSDSAWYREVISPHPHRVDAALSSGNKAITLAAKSLGAQDTEWITASEWIIFLKQQDPFDPRVGEWTALEVVRQLVQQTIDNMDISPSSLEYIHEHNVLINGSWKKPAELGVSSWEVWRNFCSKQQSVKLKSSEDLIMDYRYYFYDGSQLSAPSWERRLIAVGRLLLGLLMLKFDPPKNWNIRGLERVEPISQNKIFQSLAISSPTHRILNACLTGRSSENRGLHSHPSLFGWESGREANDLEFDPPTLIGPKALIEALTNAQEILRNNQLAASLNQPRQLIPFRLSDFSNGNNSEIGGQDNVE